MEKFSRFNDQRTGVNPFTLAPYTPTATGFAGGLVIFLLRLPLFSLVALLVVLSDVAATQLPVASLRNALKASVQRPLCKLLLLIMGVWKVDEIHVGRQSVRIRPSKSAAPSAVRRGDILLCNQSSYLDVLILAARYAPTFCATSQAGGLREVSLLEALRASIHAVPATIDGGSSSGTSESASATAAQSVDKVLVHTLSSPFRRPMVIFPEGAPTNNSAILTFTPVTDQIGRFVVDLVHGGKGSSSSSSSVSRNGSVVSRHSPSTLRIPNTHVMAFKYSWARNNNGMPPVYVVGSPWLHLFHVLCTVSHEVAVYRLPDGLEPQPADFATSLASGPAPSASAAVDGSGTRSSTTGGGTNSSNSNSSSSNVINTISGENALPPATWTQAVRDAMVQLLRGSRAVALSAADYAAFAEFYATWRSGTAAAATASSTTTTAATAVGDDRAKHKRT